MVELLGDDRRVHAIVTMTRQVKVVEEELEKPSGRGEEELERAWVMATNEWTVSHGLFQWIKEKVHVRSEIRRCYRSCREIMMQLWKTTTAAILVQTNRSNERTQSSSCQSCCPSHLWSTSAVTTALHPELTCPALACSFCPAPNMRRKCPPRMKLSTVPVHFRQPSRPRATETNVGALLLGIPQTSPPGSQGSVYH